MPEAPGQIAGPTAQQRAVRLSGLLAEAGIAVLVLRRADGSRVVLKTRETDLPASLSAACAGDAICSADERLLVTIGPDRWEWTCSDARLASMLQAGAGSA